MKRYVFWYYRNSAWGSCENSIPDDYCAALADLIRQGKTRETKQAEVARAFQRAAAYFQALGAGNSR